VAPCLPLPVGGVGHRRHPAEGERLRHVNAVAAAEKVGGRCCGGARKGEHVGRAHRCGGGRKGSAAGPLASAWCGYVIGYGSFLPVVWGLLRGGGRPCTPSLAVAGLLWKQGEQLLSAPRAHGTPVKSSGRWRAPWVSPSRGNPWQPRPTAGSGAEWPAAPTTWGHRRPRCGGVLAGAGGRTRNGFTRAAAPMPGHRSWWDANRDERGGPHRGE